MDRTLHAVSQYLSRHAEYETTLLEGFPVNFQRVLVVPFYRESVAALNRFCTWLEDTGDTLMILVSNRPDTDPARQWHRDLTAALDKTGRCDWSNGVLSLFTLKGDSAVLVVDRVLGGTPLPVRQGVGLARKIGADIACRLIAGGRVRSPWIGNTDADALLPADYWSPQNTRSVAAALIYPYRHIVPDDIAPKKNAPENSVPDNCALDHCPAAPTLLYEFSLHYYVEGLRHAGSPYAYHTLGSTLAVHYAHYAQVRGFPPRAGAEDFYLLNKLAKTGPIVSLEGPHIELLARHSDRVPFGTGPASARIAEQDHPNATELYHPACFNHLQVWLSLLDRLAEQPSTLADTLGEIRARRADGIDTDHLQAYGVQIGIEAILEHCYRQGKTAAARRRHLHTWFDAFRTMKLINWLRDHKLGTITFDQWPQYSDAWGAEHCHRLQKRFAHVQAQLTPQGNPPRSPVI